MIFSTNPCCRVFRCNMRKAESLIPSLTHSLTDYSLTNTLTRSLTPSLPHLSTAPSLSDLQFLQELVWLLQENKVEVRE